MSTNEHSSYDAPVVAVLTYHSVNVGPPEYARNDHVALATDLRRLHAAGFRFEPLDSVVDWHSGLREFPRDARIAVISFDDGATLDFEPENYPGFGLQPGFAAVLRGFLDEVGPAVQAGLRATAFVIADPHTRRRLETHNFDGRRWLADDWWAQAEAGGLIRVQNHSWDHMHAVADRVCGPNDRRGDFTAVARDADCACEIVQAARYIQSRVGGRWPNLFAYPFGHSSRYLREHWWAANQPLHRTRAAFDTAGRCVSRADSRWALPRLVCGEHWHSPDELLERLTAPC